MTATAEPRAIPYLIFVFIGHINTHKKKRVQVYLIRNPETELT